MKTRDKAFYDLCYAEWMSGGNPDNLDIDDYDYLVNGRGLDPEWDITPKHIGGTHNRPLNP